MDETPRRTGERGSHAPPRARVLVHEPEPGAIQPLLPTQDFDLVCCPSGQSLLEEIVQRVPDAVVYALGSDRQQDMGVLRLLRRVAQNLPLVLVANEGSLETMRQFHNLRPIYYGLMPVESSELVSAVTAAVSRPRAR